MDDVKGLCERLEAVRGLLAAQDDRQAKMHDLLETIREQIRLGVPAAHRPDGLFKNIQDAVYGMRGRTPLLNDVAITSPVEEAATALASLSRELAEARAERDAECLNAGRYADESLALRGDIAAADALRAMWHDRALAAEAASASKDERIGELGQVTERALPYLIHFVRQRWDGDFTYSVEEAIRRWSEGEFHNDAAESDAKARARSTKEPT